MPELDGQLRNAANNGELERVLRLLQDGALPDVPNKRGLTALQLAVGNRHHEVVGELVAAGADPFRRATSCLSPLAMAASSGDSAALRALLRTEILPEHGDLENALGWAIVSASIECIEILVEHGADPGACDPKNGRTALDHARWWRDQAHPENEPKYQLVVDHLLSYGT